MLTAAIGACGAPESKEAPSTDQPVTQVDNNHVTTNADVQPQTVLTEQDYQRAVNVMQDNLADYVYNGAVRPHWLDDGSFWYETNTKNGKQFIHRGADGAVIKTAAKLDDLGLNLPAKVEVGELEVLSPDKKKVVYLKDWNLWVRDLKSGKETQLTNDGVKDFGYATDNAGWRHSDKAVVFWSPDSKKIATYKQDQRHVKDMYLVSTNVGAPELQAWKYPLPGDKEIIKMHRVVIHVDEPKVVTFNMPPDDRRGTVVDDISFHEQGDVSWSADSKTLAFVSTSRDHKIATLRIADINTGDVRDVYEEVEDTQYESGRGVSNNRYLPESNEFIWYSQQDNWGHLYLGDLKTGQIKHQITKGEFVVSRIMDIDTKNRQIYFMANGREEGRDAYFNHFYRVDFDGYNLTLLTPENGNHSISMSPDRRYYIDNYSQINVPNVAKLRSLSGDKEVELQKQDVSQAEARGWTPAIPFTVKSADGKYDLYGVLFTPKNLDPTKKYPVINYVYPGPQGGSIGSRSFVAGYRNHQAMAELGFIVYMLDGSGNPSRSKAFHDESYGKMSVNTLPDQMSGLKQIAKEHPYMDLDRVGMWGRSGGGFATGTAMFKYPEFYKVGVSLSGNHDNRNYEDDWGERYIGLLEGDNYEKQANQLYAENLQGKLLIGTGNMDDNVPPYNTYLVVDALIKANKDFDLLIVPHARHGFGEDTNYVTRRMWDYFVINLMGATPPKEFKIETGEDD